MDIFAVIDTNVLVSAMLKKDSVPHKVIEKVFDGTVTAVISEEILAEYGEVLLRPRFNFPKDGVRRTIQGFMYRGIKLNGISVPDGETMPDPKDVAFYEVTLDAQQTREAYLVTSNGRHFPVKPFVVTPAEMLEIIEKNG